METFYHSRNSLTNNKILDVIKLKTFTDDKLNIAKMTISLFGRVNPFLIHHFETVSNPKKLQTTTEIWLLKDFKIQIA